MIRTASPRDLDQLPQLDAGSLLQDWTAQDYQAYLDRPGLILVMDYGNRLLAHAVFQVILPEAELLRIVIAPDQRGQGHGSRFLEACLVWLQSAGVETCFLEVRETNAAALALYRRHAFAEAGRRPDYYANPREDALLMRRSLVGPGAGAA
jgi:ribosomal-protein-alanine N-acetyltransferase